MSERPPCSLWQAERCALGLFGGAPSPGTCRRCDRYEGPPRGLGDVVHTVAEATGVAAVVRLTVGECEGCRRRRRQWNCAEPPVDVTERAEEGFAP